MGDPSWWNLLAVVLIAPASTLIGVWLTNRGQRATQRDSLEHAERMARVARLDESSAAQARAVAGAISETQRWEIAWAGSNLTLGALAKSTKTDTVDKMLLALQSEADGRAMARGACAFALLTVEDVELRRSLAALARAIEAVAIRTSDDDFRRYPVRKELDAVVTRGTQVFAGATEPEVNNGSDSPPTPVAPRPHPA